MIITYFTFSNYLHRRHSLLLFRAVTLYFTDIDEKAVEQYNLNEITSKCSNTCKSNEYKEINKVNVQMLIFDVIYLSEKEMYSLFCIFCTLRKANQTFYYTHLFRRNVAATRDVESEWELQSKKSPPTPQSW